MKKLFKDWNYKKHAKFVTGVYLTMYSVDMTIGYKVVKKCLEKSGIEHDEDSEVKEIL